MAKRKVISDVELKQGQVVPCPIGETEEGYPREALVVRDAAGEVRAYLNECQHLPIPIDSGSGDYLSEDGQYLLCSTHGALYRLDDGMCIEGPCIGDALVPLPIELDDDGVWILVDR